MSSAHVELVPARRGWRQLRLRVFAFGLIQFDDDAFNCSLRNILLRMITRERTSTNNKSNVSSSPSFIAGLPRLRKLHLRQRTPRDGMHKARNHPLCTASTSAIGTHQRAQSRPRLPHAQHPSRVRDPEKQRERRPHVSSRGRETELLSWRERAATIPNAVCWTFIFPILF